MLKLTHHNVTIEIRTRQEERQDSEAIVVPASKQQRNDLGSAAVGQAWMAWSPDEATPKVIKFIPPPSTSESEWRELLRSYCSAIRIAEVHKVASLVVPLPQQAGLMPVEDVLAARLSLAILEECRTGHHLEHLRLVAAGNQEAVLYANWLVEIHAGRGPSLEQAFQDLLS